MQHFDKDACVM